MAPRGARHAPSHNPANGGAAQADGSAIELLISALDALDVTVEDIEEDDHGEEGRDEEPSLGWTDAEARKAVPFQGPIGAYDLEDEHDGREPSLGSPERSCWFYETYGGTANGPDRNRSGDQTRWAQGARDDGEDEHDGREPDVDGEPSLWAVEWPVEARQVRSADGLTLISRSLHQGSQEAWAAGAFGAGSDGERDDCDHEDKLQPVTLNPS